MDTLPDSIAQNKPTWQCPGCPATMQHQPATRQFYCATCGLLIPIPASEADEVGDLLLGISDTDPAIYLHILALGDAAATAWLAYLTEAAEQARISVALAATCDTDNRLWAQLLTAAQGRNAAYRAWQAVAA